MSEEKVTLPGQQRREMIFEIVELKSSLNSVDDYY